MELNVRINLIFVDLLLLISIHLLPLPPVVSSRCFSAASFRMRYTNVSRSDRREENVEQFCRLSAAYLYIRVWRYPLIGGSSLEVLNIIL